MNKTDLINEVARVVKTKKEAATAINNILQAITETLSKGEAVTLVGFGTFKSVKRKARMGRNPRTGETIKIKAQNAVQFISGKALKDALK